MSFEDDTSEEEVALLDLQAMEQRRIAKEQLKQQAIEKARGEGITEEQAHQIAKDVRDALSNVEILKRPSAVGNTILWTLFIITSSAFFLIIAYIMNRWFQASP